MFLGKVGRSAQGFGRRMKAASAALTVLLLAFASPVISAGSDYIPAPPPTVYEDSAMSPQTMDYDRENRMFIAHPGWIRDRLIHYYKFRMYTPMTYPERVRPGEAPDIPIGQLFLLTTNGDFSGVVAGQKPILRWHTSDGESYSDFVEVVWVAVGPSYVANTYRSHADLLENGVALEPSGVYVNVPVVPSGSRLQDPSGNGVAPILPLMTWYRGVEVQTFAFETTSTRFANHFNPLTRTGTAGQPGSGFEITVAPFVAGARASFIPIWHLNQYSTGVQSGVNHGGPWSGGQRNVIDLDRGAAGYSPLWQVFWVAAVPVGYSADQVSSADQITEANGFEVIQTPMFVNCPNVGPVGGSATNPSKTTSFGRTQVTSGETVRIEGALVMEAGVAVDAFVGDAKVASTLTSMMGAYEFDLATEPWPEGTNTLTVKDSSGNTLQTIALTKLGPRLVESPTLIGGVALAVLVAVALLLLWRRRRPTATDVRPDEESGSP